MARKLVEGFESDSMYLWDLITGGEVYETSGVFSIMDGSYFLWLHGSGARYVRTPFSSTLSTLYLALRLSYYGNNSGTVYFADTAGTVMMSITRNVTTGLLELRIGNFTSTVVATGTHSIGWGGTSATLLEIKYIPSNTDGTVEIKVDGEQDILYTSSKDTTAGLEAVKYLYLYNSDGGGYGTMYDNVIVDDADWIGNSNIQAIFPSGTGTTTQFTPGGINRDNPQCSGGSSTDGDTFTNEANAFDDNSATYATSVATGGGCVDVSWMGYDFGVGVTKSIVGFYLDQSVSNYIVPSVMARYSDDGTTWYNVQDKNIVVVAYGNYIGFPPCGAHRYWSIICKGAPTSGWRINELDFFEAETANWDAVNDLSFVTSDKVSSNTNGYIDTYVFGNLVGDIGLIKSVQVQALVSKKGASSVDHIKMIARPGSTNRESSEIDAPYGPSVVSYIWETNPDTSVAWLESEVNASEFGIEAVT